MASNTPTTGPAGPGGRRTKKQWYQNPWVLVAGGGALLALIMLARRGQAAQNSGTTTAGSTTQPVVSPAGFSDAGVGAYQNLQAELEALQGQLNAQGALSPGSPAQTVVSTSPTTYQPGFYTVGKDVKTWADIANNRAKFFTNQSGSASLDDLVKLNPGLNVRAGAPAPAVGSQVRIF